MKNELFFSILTAIMSPSEGDIGVYHSHTWHDQWVNVSVNTLHSGYKTQDRLYVGTTGMENNIESLVLRIDRHGTKLFSYDKIITDQYIKVDCAKKVATTTHIVYRNLRSEITSTLKIEKTQPDTFDDSHLFGALCTARALNQVLINQEVKTFDSCDFRQQVKGSNDIQYGHWNYKFPVKWNIETCKAVKNAIWLYGIGQKNAAILRLAWVPQLASLLNEDICSRGICKKTYESKLSN